MRSIKFMSVVFVALTVAGMLVAQSQSRNLQLSDIRIGIPKDVALEGLRANHEVRQIQSSVVDEWYVDGKNDQGQISFVQNRVASISQYIGGSYKDQPTITLGRDLYRLLRLDAQSAPDGKRRVNLQVEFLEQGVPGFGSTERIVFQVAPGRHVSLDVILPDNTAEAGRSVTLSTFRNVP